MKIEIYINTDAKSVHPNNHGHSWYMMESTYKGKPLIRKRSMTWMEHNRNGAMAEGLLFALQQIKATRADIYLYADDNYISRFATNDQIRSWEANGYLTSKGDYIKNRDLWEQIGAIVEMQGLILHTTKGIPEEKRSDLEHYEKPV